MLTPSDPNNAEALQRLGLAALQQGRPDAAAEALAQSVRADPSLPATHFFLGLALRAQGRWEEAAASFRQSLRLNPASAAAHNNLGDVLLQLRRWDEAAAALREAVRLKPDFVEAHNNLGIALVKLRQLEEAEAHCREALRLRPDYFPACSNLGNIFQERWQLDEAAAWFGRALRLRPDNFPAAYGLGNILRIQGKMGEGLAWLDRALGLQPDHAEARLSRGMALLLRGDWQRGWPDYEWRHRCPNFRPLPKYLPRWDGSPLAGRSVLVLGEQGLGDNIQFIRYAPLVKQRGGTVVVECQPALARLLADCPGVDRVVPEAPGQQVPADVFVPLLNLPPMFGTTPDTVPASVPYLRTDPARVETWRRELAAVAGLKVGIVWQGNPNFLGDRWRSVPLEQFAQLAGVPGVRLYSLQKGVGREQLPPLAERFGLTDLGERLPDLVDTAALMRNLDLVISTDTSVPHLAGALGVPVWVALSYTPDWRWLLDREDCPWYPTMRLFRQKAPGDWADVFARIAAALRERAAGQGTQADGADTRS